MNKVHKETWELDELQVRITAGSGWIGDTAARPGYSTTPDDEARMRLIACAPEMVRMLLRVEAGEYGLCEEFDALLKKAGVR